MSKICEHVGSRAGFVAHLLPSFLSQFVQNSHRHPLQWPSFKQNKKDLDCFYSLLTLPEQLFEFR